MKVVDSSTELRSKKALIEAFLKTLNVNSAGDIHEDWQQFTQKQKEQDFQTIVIEEHLNEQKARAYLKSAFDTGALKTEGTAIDEFMPPISRFGGNRAEKKQHIIERLQAFFDEYFGL